LKRHTKKTASTRSLQVIQARSTPTAPASVVRLVLDTNAAVSGFLWRGNPGKLIDAAQAGSLTLCTRAPLLAELHGVLAREKFTKHLQDRELTATQVVERALCPEPALDGFRGPALLNPDLTAPHA
jgi:hypothetical protein